MALKMEQLISLGIVVIFIGILIVVIGLLSSAKEGSSKTKIAVGGFIGFIPFGFGNDKNFIWFVTALSVIMFLIWVFIMFGRMKP